MRSLNRKSHVGKNSFEKEAYKNFLSQRFKLDKTEDDPDNPAKTDSSTFEQEEVKGSVKPQRTSFKLRFSDYLQNNWSVTILGGLIVLVTAGAFWVVVTQNIHGEKISNVEKRVDKLEDRNDQMLGSISTLGKNLDVFKAEIGKDIQYLKEKLVGASN